MRYRTTHNSDELLHRTNRGDRRRRKVKASEDHESWKRPGGCGGVHRTNGPDLLFGVGSPRSRDFHRCRSGAQRPDDLPPPRAPRGRRSTASPSRTSDRPTEPPSTGNESRARCSSTGQSSVKFGGLTLTLEPVAARKPHPQQNDDALSSGAVGSARSRHRGVSPLRGPRGHLQRRRCGGSPR